MSLKKFSNGKKRQVVPDLTPLIDVVFLLLIFFMVATTFNDMGGLEIELPKSSSIKESAKDIDEISILVGKGKEIKLKTDILGRSAIEDVNLENLGTELQSVIERSKEKKVGIVADREIDYGDVVDIMSIAKEKGALSIDIETERK
ncbi:ExbD/TolR family protein [Psychrilyobacter atlanticus]|uniref:ExbD/TolR family protein n=1 Tax=Psychrilyobacter atlanticus TaxID=271091 RepID=UPI00041CFABD|nr:biopolymer transporter ExbD [Psychrilyobacter atlanticus]